jgi:CBS-domain-containing membrane protein
LCATELDPGHDARAVVLQSRVTGHLSEIARRTPIGTVMAPTLLAVRDDAEVDVLQRELLGRTGRVMPVVTAEGRLLGIVSTDRLGAQVPPPPPSRPELRELLELLTPSSIREVMTAQVLAFPESGRVSEALNAMLVERVRFLPIVSDEGAVVGLVWDVHILSWLGRALHAEREAVR